MSARPRRIMLLVDFDNVSPDVIGQAFDITLRDYGAVHVRRAYCTAEHAQHNAGFMKRLSLRPMVNLSVGKNSTDIALAVDAMDLVIAERPDVVVIVSSDSDFTPLVGRLREKGAWVRGFGQQGKTSDGVQAAYDEYDDLSHRDAKAATKRAQARPAPKPVPKPAPKPAPRVASKPVPAPAPIQAPVPAPASAPVPAPVPVPVRVPTPAPVPVLPPAVEAKKPARKRSPRAKAAEPDVQSATAQVPAQLQKAAEPALPAEVEAILQAVPQLRNGDRVELGEAAQALRQAGMLGKTAASTRLFRKHAEHFVLSPELQPNKVQFWPDAGN